MTDRTKIVHWRHSPQQYECAHQLDVKFPSCYGFWPIICLRCLNKNVHLTVPSSRGGSGLVLDVLCWIISMDFPAVEWFLTNQSNLFTPTPADSFSLICSSDGTNLYYFSWISARTALESRTDWRRFPSFTRSIFPKMSSRTLLPCPLSRAVLRSPTLTSRTTNSRGQGYLM